MVEHPSLSVHDPTFWFAVGPDIAALAATCLVLVFWVTVYCNPETRPALRRQSLQMLFSVQIATLLFGTAHIITFTKTSSTLTCELSVLVVLFASNFQHFVIMLIAVNLQLTVVHAISTAGFTKWYIGGSLVAAIITCIPGAVARVWGYDPLIGMCWTVLEPAKDRIAWTVGTTYAWTVMSAAVTFISTCVVILQLCASSRRIRKAFSFAGLSSGEGLPRQNILHSVTIRILPHPVFLVISNIVVFITDLFISRNRQKEGQINDFRIHNHLDVVFCIFYTTPPLFFACTILFFDPSLSKAIRSLLSPSKTGTTSPPNAHILSRATLSTETIPPLTTQAKDETSYFPHHDSKSPSASFIKMVPLATTVPHPRGRISWQASSRNQVSHMSNIDLERLNEL